MRLSGIITLAFVALAVAACGGGGGGGSTTPSVVSVATNAAPAPTGTALPAGYARANVSITVPGTGTASNGRRGAQNVGVGTTSIQFTLLQTSSSVATPAPQIFGLLATSPGCVTISGNIQCTLGVNAPIGNDVFLAQTYNVSGGLTGSGAVQLSVAQNTVNTASLTLSGQVATVYLADSNFLQYLGNYEESKSRRGAQAKVASLPTVTQMQIFVIAQDNQGNIILNPSIFTTPVYLQQVFFGTNPDVTLQVVPGVEGGSTTSTSANYGSVQVNSPSDVITATLIPNVANAAYEGLILANIGSPLLALNAALPTTPPTGTLEFSISEPSAPNGVFTVYDSNLNDAAVTNINLPAGNPDYTDYFYVYEGNFYGDFSLTTTGTCPGSISLTLQNDGDYGQITATATNAGTENTCSAVVSDGEGDSITLPVYVTTTTVTGS